MRQNHRGRGRAGVIPPFLWFRARPEPPRSGVLDQATLALVPLNLDGYPTPQDPVQRLVSIDVKSGVEKQLATLDPPPDSILAGRISLHPDGNRLAVSFVRQHGKIYMLEGFDESTSWFDRLMRRFKRAGTAVVRIVGKLEVETSAPFGRARTNLQQSLGAVSQSLALLQLTQLTGSDRSSFRAASNLRSRSLWSYCRRSTSMSLGLI